MNVKTTSRPNGLPAAGESGMDRSQRFPNYAGGIQYVWNDTVGCREALAVVAADRNCTSVAAPGLRELRSRVAVQRSPLHALRDTAPIQWYGSWARDDPKMPLRKGGRLHHPSCRIPSVAAHGRDKFWRRALSLRLSESGRGSSIARQRSCAAQSFNADRTEDRYKALFMRDAGVATKTRQNIRAALDWSQQVAGLHKSAIYTGRLDEADDARRSAAEPIKIARECRTAERVG